MSKSSPGMRQRARKPDEKAQRKQSIVDALQTLLAQSRFPLPSANDIAQAAGVSKGVIYHYFASREEIFLTLYLQQSAAFFADVEQLLTPEQYRFVAVKNYVTGFFCSNDIFAYLGLLAPSVLEANVSVAFVTEFKQAAASKIDEMATRWALVEPDLESVAIREFVVRFYYLALMQWQHHHPSDSVQQAFRDSSLWLMEGNLLQALEQSFDWLWQGMAQGSNALNRSGR